MRLTRRWRGLADRRSDQVRQSRRNMAGLYRAQEAGTGDEGILDGCDGDGGSAMLGAAAAAIRSEEHTSELQSLMRISYAVFCLNKKKERHRHTTNTIIQ